MEKMFKLPKIKSFFVLILIVNLIASAVSNLDVAQAQRSISSDLHSKRDNLLYHIRSEYSDSCEKPFSYNLLLEIPSQKPMNLIDKIDYNWVEEQAYENYRESKDLYFKQANTLRASPLDKIAYILASVPDLRPDAKDILFVYNYVRELLNKPKANSISQIDFEWLQEVKKLAYQLKIKFEGNFRDINLAQQELINQAVKAVDLKREIMAFKVSKFDEKFGGAAQAGANFVALSNNPDLDLTIAMLYHELGHIVHGDADFQFTTLNDAQKRLNDPIVKEDLERISSYFEKGKLVLDKSSELGRNIKEFLAKYPALRVRLNWTPYNHEEYLIQLARLAKERRADLFALEKLYEQGKINEILTLAAWFGTNKSIANEYTSHPTPIERSLYMLGFLANKAIDINQLLREWEEQGICTAGGEELMSEPAVPSQLARDMEDMYDQWEKENDNLRWSVKEMWRSVGY